MNWTGILNRVKVALNQPFTDADTDEGTWTNAQILQIANDYMREMASDSGCLYSESTFASVSGQREYEEKSDVNRVIGVYWNNGTDYVPLARTSIEELDRLELEGRLGSPWRNESGTPIAWYPEAERGVIGAYPEPNVSTAAKFKKRYSEQVTEMTVGTSVPFNSEYNLYDYHRGIVYGVVAHFLDIEGENSASWARKYENVKKQLKRHCDQDYKPITFNLVSRRRGIKRNVGWPLGM